MFKSPDQALAFAFKMRSSSVVSIPSSTYIANKTDSQHSSERLTQYDRHAQAGMIFAWLSRRPEDEQIYAFFLHGTLSEKKLAAALFIRLHHDSLKKYKLSHRELRNAVLGHSVRAVADASGMTKNKSWRFRRELAEIFQPIQDRLMSALYDEVIAKQELD